MDYISPIEINVTNDIVADLRLKMKGTVDGQILKAVWNAGVEVDKEELLKALRYDRNQYVQGFQDAKAKYEKALDKACGILAVYNGYPSKEDEAIIHSNCILANGKQKWKEALLELEENYNG